MSTQSFIKDLYHQFDLDKREVDLVLCYVLKVNTAGLFIYDKKISQQQEDKINTSIQERISGKPLAYITGSKQFWKYDFNVNQHTLIPRPETEQIIEIVLNKTSKDYTGKILDLGTGTGAIALSIAHERPNAAITAIDYSEDCIKITNLNKQKLELTNVSIFQSNWFDSIKDNSFDIIVSNPPYIAENDKHLDNLKFEPIKALTAKNNGYSDLEKIIKESVKFLNNNGMILLEHGYNQYSQVQKILHESNYCNIKSHKDLAGIYRITTANIQ